MNKPSTSAPSAMQKLGLLALATGMISTSSAAVDGIQRLKATVQTPTVSSPRCTVDAASVQGEERSKLIAAATRMGCIVKTEQATAEK